MAAGVYPADIAIPSLPRAAFLLKRIDGRLEDALAPDATGMISRLLGALLTDRAGTPVDLAAVPLAVHDRLVALVYLAELGPSVKGRADCRGCGESFEFGFSLTELLANQDAAAAEIGPPADDGYWRTAAGVRIRPPTLGDARAEDSETLLSRIAGNPVPIDQHEAVSAFLEQASPLLSLDVETTCPSCRESQPVWFDLARFLLDALATERPFLIREVHLIAARYGWSHGEIMGLRRDDRRAFAALIESERSAALRRAS